MNERNEVIIKLLDRADIKPGMRILDIGCATGEVTQLAAERVGSQGEVIGIDMNQTLLEKQLKIINIITCLTSTMIFINYQKH